MSGQDFTTDSSAKKNEKGMSFGPHDVAKKPHLKAHSGRTRTQNGPFCSAILAE
ncbi:hypothetical protein HMPREF6485_1466 [Segatella buccae ATCC 33574]|uniref:Uncharacterized protein n=1 Tax=Segatella buccae ATCC 33574 TaxID=873513 RepID=E6K7N4_9BACT|nr:hypothetical protein HMPREF6485_1466 [Segatella buccae ATCC 33574]